MQPLEHDLSFGLQHRSVVGMSRNNEVWFDKPRVSSPEALTLMHLEQPVLDARVNAGGDEALDFLALACKGSARRRHHRRG